MPAHEQLQFRVCVQTCHRHAALSNSDAGVKPGLDEFQAVESRSFFVKEKQTIAHVVSMLAQVPASVHAEHAMRD